MYANVIGGIVFYFFFLPYRTEKEKNNNNNNFKLWMVKGEHFCIKPTHIKNTTYMVSATAHSKKNQASIKIKMISLTYVDLSI